MKRIKVRSEFDTFAFPQLHPLRSLQVMTDEATAVQPRFNSLYAKIGRPSIVPEKLSRALLLQALGPGYCAATARHGSNLKVFP
jgi:hypothetical protein